MSDNILSLQGIEKAYNRGMDGEVTVLKALDLAIAPAQVVALVAPSGAGKSTLLHIAGLLDTADSGQVEIDGVDMRGLDDKARTVLRRQDIGFIYQFHHLLPEFSALENIVIPQLANNVEPVQARDYAMDLLAKVGIADRAGHRPAALSGGNNSGWPFVGRWRTGPNCFWLMSRRETLIRQRRTRFLHCCCNWCATLAYRR